MNTKLKLFIWTDFSPNYSGGLAFAIAHDETEARKLVEEQRGCDVFYWGDLEVRRLDQRVARCVIGGG